MDVDVYMEIDSEKQPIKDFLQRNQINYYKYQNQQNSELFKFIYILGLTHLRNEIKHIWLYQ